MSVRDRWGEPQQRAIAAARSLAEEGGYDAVQIRNVVARTGLSTATIYRHFSSKDHLIAAAQLEWTRSLPDANRRLPPGGTAADRVVELVQRTCRAFGRSPNLGKALMLTLGSPDPGVRACLVESDELVLRTVREAIGDDLPDPDVVLGPLGIAWHGALLAWAHDHISMDEVVDLLQRTVRLLFAGAQAGAPPDASPGPTDAAPAAQHQPPPTAATRSSEVTT